MAVGDEVAFRGPEGTFVLREAPYHVFVGEETAQVAFGALLREVPARVAVYGVIELETTADRLPVARHEELAWLAGSGVSLLEAVRALPLPDTPGFAYIAGEAKACAAVRRHFAEERGWPARSAIAVKPFWAPGKRGLE